MRTSAPPAVKCVVKPAVSKVDVRNNNKPPGPR